MWAYCSSLEPQKVRCVAGNPCAWANACDVSTNAVITVLVGNMMSAWTIWFSSRIFSILQCGARWQVLFVRVHAVSSAVPHAACCLAW